MNLTQELTRLREEHGSAQKHLHVVGELINNFTMLIGSGSARQRLHGGRSAAGTTGVIQMPHPAKRRLSAAGRKRIAAAQKARWAKSRSKVVNAGAKKAA
jgi:hypothetical protein